MCSKWKESKTLDLSWTSVNCVEGTVTIQGMDNGQFICRDTNGMLVSQFPENSFNDAVRFMEETFSWNVSAERILVGSK